MEWRVFELHFFQHFSVFSVDFLIEQILFLDNGTTKNSSRMPKKVDEKATDGKYDE